MNIQGGISGNQQVQQTQAIYGRGNLT